MSINLAQPLRVALIGLSGSAVTSWAATAHLPSLLTSRGRRDYVIAALCNSSVSAAQAATKTFDLDPNATKTHGSPADLARDADIDIVICNTRVDKHYETTLPSMQAGKDVYIEWPIASSLAQIEEMVAVAKEKKIKAAVGLQGRWAPPVLKLKELLHAGNLGKLLSSEVRAFGGVQNRASLPEGLRYFADRKIGGNPIVIGFTHVIDFVQSVVGELEPSKTHAHLQIQRPELRIRKSGSGSEPDKFVHSDVPDLASVHGALEDSAHVSKGATLSAYFRTGQPFPGEPALRWSLNCERGEIRLTALAGISLQASAYQEPVKIEVHDFAKDVVEEVAWAWSETQLEVPVSGRSVQSCLYAFAEGDANGWVSIEDAAKRARQIQHWL